MLVLRNNLITLHPHIAGPHTMNIIYSTTGHMIVQSGVRQQAPTLRFVVLTVVVPHEVQIVGVSIGTNSIFRSRAHLRMQKRPLLALHHLAAQGIGHKRCDRDSLGSTNISTQTSLLLGKSRSSRTDFHGVFPARSQRIYPRPAIYVKKIFRRYM